MEDFAESHTRLSIRVCAEIIQREDRSWCMPIVKPSDKILTVSNVEIYILNEILTWRRSKG